MGGIDKNSYMMMMYFVWTPGGIVATLVATDRDPLKQINTFTKYHDATPFK